MMVYLNRLIFVCLCWIFCPITGLGQTSTDDERINDLLDRIDTEKRYVEDLIDNNLTNLPVGIKKTISNHKIVIGIDSARITPQGMLINAYTRLTFPGSEKYILFRIRNALITPAGLSTAGPTRLEMISDFSVKLNDQVTLLLPADGSNFVDWDCNGFRSVSLSGLFEFSSETFIPDDPKISDKVTAQFIVNTTDLNNILVSTSITPFRIKGLGDMAFNVLDASVDMSDFVNCPGFAMPDDYRMIFPDDPQLWRGFFLKEVSVRLPSELNNSQKPTEVKVKDLLIDEFGISGRFSATNILESGSASGWPFSIKSLEIGLSQNKLAGGAMAGIIHVPFLGDEPLGYDAQIVSGRECMDYSFTIKGEPDRDFPLPFGGKVRLDKGCIFNMKTVNGRFIPSAILNGSLYISAEPADIEGLRFERLYLTAESPYIKGGVFDAASGISCSLAGFGLSIDSVSLGFKSGKAALAFNTKISLMNKSDKGVSASTRFILNASVKKEPGTEQLKWGYDGILLEGVRIRGNVSLFYLSGDIAIFNDHPVYGDAFIGKVGFTAGKLIRDTVLADVTFGKMVDFRYWFARVNIPAKIPVGMVTLTHLGGGAYSNMTRKNLMDPNSDYIPEKDAGMGFLAETGLYVKAEKIFNAEALFEIAINKTGGIRYVSFTGEGKFFSEADKENNLVKTSALVNMVYDNTNDCFHANLSVFMNIANALRGIGPNDLLGEAVIHVDPDDWYVYIGRPSSPLGVKVIGLMTAQTYFMAGTKIEQMPLPPSEVSSIISNINLDFMQGERGVATGRGFAFGVRFEASAGIGKDKGFVYAYFNAGAGADIMLQDYGEARCEGRSGPIGINGWYASGQGYAYLTGKIGVRVKRKEFDIMSVAAALLVQAKMPNPAWFRGAIAARYSILGGLVKGKVNVTVVLGEECILVTNGDELGDLQLIGDISPAQGEEDVDVFAAPQVSFNTTIDKEFGMINLSDQYAVYRVRLDEFKLLTADNLSLTSSIQWNPLHDMATLKLTDILPGRRQLTASVKVHIEKKTGSGWEALTGDPETKTSKFNTGDEPKSIPESNVAYSYPIRNQHNFHRSEYPSGYITLKSGQPRLFDTQRDGISLSILARFRSNSKTIEVPVTYYEAQKTLRYDIPGELLNSTVYEMSIIRRPVSSDADANLIRSSRFVSTPNREDTLSIARTEITGTIAAETVSDLHSFSFRTSAYSTFSEKIRSISSWQDQVGFDEKAGYMKRLYVRAKMNETFDKYEIEGEGSEVQPLVALEAKRGNAWIDSHVYPLVYELYGTGGLTVERNTEILGLFPSKAMYLSNINSIPYLLDQSNNASTSGDIYIMYYIPPYVYKDYYELLGKAVAKYVDTNVPAPLQAQRLIEGRLKNVFTGSYPFTLSYRLPGTNIITTSGSYNIKY